jgi:BirA family biotin operon repressor/biotin-[acetyl-CoA-carboxylase] ligase
VSIALWDYLDHPKPHLLGMSMALAAAGAVKCQLRWPNDLIFHSRKVGGLLSQVVVTPNKERVPVIGVGINLNQTSFPPELEVIATSLFMETGREFSRDQVLSDLLDELEHLPEPTAWSDLAAIWDVFDQTPGKLYKLPDGNFAQALGVGSDGQLICSIDGETSSVQVADALFGG